MTTENVTLYESDIADKLDKHGIYEHEFTRKSKYTHMTDGWGVESGSNNKRETHDMLSQMWLTWNSIQSRDSKSDKMWAISLHFRRFSKSQTEKQRTSCISSKGWLSRTFDSFWSLYLVVFRSLLLSVCGQFTFAKQMPKLGKETEVKFWDQTFEG